MRVLIVDDQVRLTETAYDGNEVFRLTWTTRLPPIPHIHQDSPCGRP